MAQLQLEAPQFASEQTLLQIVSLIGQQRPVEDALNVLCHQPVTDGEPQLAFFLLEGEHWRVAAKGALRPAAEVALARLSPARLSAAAQVGPGIPITDGWARCFSSEMGELLGMVVYFADGPVLPCGLFASRLDTVCRLAALAVEQRNLLDELAFRAEHDELTGLFNRGYYERALDRLLRGGARPGVLHMGLDRFRMVNDVIGYSAGNRLLNAVGHRLRAALAPPATLARIGGDEFAVLLPSTRNIDTAAEVAGRLLEALTEPFVVDDNEILVTASIGVACGEPGSTAESMEHEAYVALYHAKHSGKSRAIPFENSMASTPPERLETEKRLRSALERREMLLFYQPQVDLAGGHVTGAEVLCRWQPEGVGMVSPSVFVPILEETGLIVDVGRWVLMETCRQGNEWINMHGNRLRLGVNVSAVQLRRSDIVRDVEQALSATGFPASLLELELTESVLVHDFEGVARVLRNLRALGVTVALDDFGTGQSSLSYLHHLPFQRIKLDQSFIRPIADGHELPPVVEGIIKLATSLGIATIAEGIETEHQNRILCTAGCGEGQGFYFGRPLIGEEFVVY